MNLTLLIDLDDTLLGNKMEHFIPAYLQALAKRMIPYTNPQHLVKVLLSATEIMTRNNDPSCTLKEVFDAAFYPEWGFDVAEVNATITSFYAEDFPHLRKLTQQRPQAVQLVEKALQLGCRVGIATNPLFPRTAIIQRLEWAGLPVDRYPFSLVPSYNTFHFAKPNPAFFAECLAQMGWPEGPAMMVGDDIEMDIAAARQIGLPAFWISDNETDSWNGAQPLPHGTLESLIPWLEATPAEALMPELSTPEALLAVLRSTPAALNTLSATLSDEEWRTPPVPGEWSPVEIVCHLRDTDAEVNLERLHIILQHENPFLPGRDTDPWAEQRQYILQDGPQALKAFTTTRLQLLTLLESLQPQDWKRTARHAIFGPSRLQELISFITGHDRLHIQQINQTIQQNTSLTD